MVYEFFADGFEEVEAITPLDYLRRCGAEVLSVGINSNEVCGAHGIKIITDFTIDEISMAGCEGIVLPGGGNGTKALGNCKRLLEILEIAVNNKLIIGAICAAPSILGRAGYLKGKNATCYPGFEKELIGANCSANAVEIADNIITARGAGVSNQFAFALCEKLVSKEKAEEIKAAVQY